MLAAVCVVLEMAILGWAYVLVVGIGVACELGSDRVEWRQLLA